MRLHSSGSCPDSTQHHLSQPLPLTTSYLLNHSFPSTRTVQAQFISLSSLSCINIMVLYLIHIFPYCRFHLSHCLRHARDFLGLQKGTQATTGLALISPSLIIGNHSFASAASFLTTSSSRLPRHFVNTCPTMHCT